MNDPVAIDHIARALRLSPRDSGLYLFYAAIALAHFIAGDYDATIVPADLALNMRPTYLLALRLKASALGWLRRHDDGRQIVNFTHSIDSSLNIGTVPRRRYRLRPDDMTRFVDVRRRPTERAGLPEEQAPDAR